MNVIIDGKSCAFELGEYLINVAERNGVTIPTLCRHKGMYGRGCCRVCIVEVEQGGWKSIVAACIYPLERECEVFTNSERVMHHRKIILSLLRSQAPESKEVARLCEAYGATEIERFVAADGKKNGKCILCGLCAEACAELGTGAISTVNRGVDKAVSTPYDDVSLVCVGCKSCAEVCPTGAIEVVEDGDNRTIWGKTLPLKKCKCCGAVIGTFYELTRAAERLNDEPATLCTECKQKGITDVMAETYGI